MSSNGKIDRKALPKIDVTENRIFVAPRNELEGKLCRLFEEILNTTGIGIDDSFFDNGGHSLRATSLNNKIGQYFGLRLSLRDIFNHPTVRQLAEIIKQLNLSVSRSDEMKIRREGNLTIQSAPETRKTMYLLSQSGRANTTYNMPSCMLIEEGLDPIKVEKVYQMIVAKHEALRTSFRMEENEIVQIIHDQLQFEIHYEEVEDEQKEINTVIRRFVRPFKLSIAPIFRVKICRLADEKFLLLTDYHKIICDEISREQILTEFMKIYTGEELPEMKYELMKVSTN